MVWIKSVLAILFFLLVESFLVGFIIFILLNSITAITIGFSYFQIVGCVWGIKLLLNNIFALATHNVSDEEFGITDDVDENINIKNNLA